MMTFRQFLLEKKKPKKHKWGVSKMKVSYGHGWSEKIIKQMSQDQLEKELWD